VRDIGLQYVALNKWVINKSETFLDIGHEFFAQLTLFRGGQVCMRGHSQIYWWNKANNDCDKECKKAGLDLTHDRPRSSRMESQ